MEPRPMYTCPVCKGQYVSAMAASYCCTDDE